MCLFTRGSCGSACAANSRYEAACLLSQSPARRPTGECFRSRGQAWAAIWQVAEAVG